MKRKISLFKNLNLSSKKDNEAWTLLYPFFYKILKLNLRKNCFEEIKVTAKEKNFDKGYSNNFSDWTKNYAKTGNIYKDDQELYLQFVDINNIKRIFKETVQKQSIKYRRNINGNMRWVTLELVPSSNFSEKNQIVYLYVYDIHDALSKELNNSHFSYTISEAIAKTYINCVYLDLENDYSKVIHTKDYIKSVITDLNTLKDCFEKTIQNLIDPSCRQRMKDFCNLKTLDQRLKNKTIISTEYINSKGSLSHANFIPVTYNEEGKLKSVIYSNQYVDGEIIKLREQLETEKTLVECLTTLSSTDDFAQANKLILKNICNFYDANKAIIFKIDDTDNTAFADFEWYNTDTELTKKNLQKIDLDIFSRWKEILNTKNIILFSDCKNELKNNIEEYNFLKSYNINSIIVSPFNTSEDKLIGFMVIIEPKKNLNSDIVVRSATTYIMEEKLKQNYTEELYKMSYSDIMTKTFNRAAYIRDMNKIHSDNELNIGILYADVNGLKETNDTKGHKAGDILIDSAVAILRKYFYRKQDLLYRIGGDEFVVISSDISEKEFHTALANLKDILKSNWILSCGGKWFKSINDIDQSTKDAEKEMYKHKAEYYSSNNHFDRRK